MKDYGSFIFENRKRFPVLFINLNRQSYFSDDYQTKSADKYRGEKKKERQDKALNWSHPT